MLRKVNRRHFLRAAALAASAGMAPQALTAFGQDAKTAKFIFSSPLTHSDWMLRPTVEWGPKGVRQMLDACREWGFSRIHWRALDGGRSLYKSKLLKPMGKWDEDSYWSPQTDADKELVQSFNPGMSDISRRALLKKFDALDYAGFDPLAEAVPYAHKIGLHIDAWVTINEDDHGWGLQSEFSKKHPKCRWRRRNGKPYHSQLSFAFSEVSRYKLAILRELLENYDLDGFFLDWIRTGDVRDNPQNDPEGVADYGYEKPLADLFSRKHRRTPLQVPNSEDAWVRQRSEPQTRFMRDARKLLRRRGTALPLSVLVGHPWHYRGLMNKIDGNLRGLLLDTTAWASERLIDAAVPAGYYRDNGTAETACRALGEETQGATDIWSYAWVPQNVAELDQSLDIAAKTGCKQVLFWEADYIHDRSNAQQLSAALRTRASQT